jgi:hypothetical protein
MNKTLEAILRGYLFFQVNDKYFLTYTPAREHRKTLSDSKIKRDINFKGYHIFKGWVTFYYSFYTPPLSSERL